MSSLIIVPCGKRKIWDNDPYTGMVPAKDAYCGNLFALNRAFAEKFGDYWIILSAKYGYLDPDSRIENYDVTFSKSEGGCITREQLHRQVADMKLKDFSPIIGLGGKAYRDIIAENFVGCTILFPFEGCRGIGEMMQRLKAALS